MKEATPRLRIEDLEGEFHQDADKTREYLSLKNGEKISFLFVFGVVVDKQDGDNFSALVLDDFTGTIRVVAFGDNIERLREIKKGDELIINGRLRSNENEGIYVVLRNLEKIEEPNDELLFRSEILRWRKRLGKNKG